MELGEAGRTNPLEVPSRKFDERFWLVGFVFLKRIRTPYRVAVSLLVESSVDRNAPDLALRLKQTERQGQGGVDALLLAFLPKVSDLCAQDGLEAIGVQRTI